MLRVFTVYDSKAEAYLPPFYMATVGSATRAFTDSANDPNHSFHKHPADYTLFLLGEYDEQKGTFDTSGPRTAIGTALEYRTPREIPFGDPDLPHLEAVQ